MGGMTLSGDDLTTIPPDRLAMLKKLLPPAGVAAEFEDDSLRVGVTQLPDSEWYRCSTGARRRSRSLSDCPRRAASPITGRAKISAATKDSSRSGTCRRIRPDC